MCQIRTVDGLVVFNGKIVLIKRAKPPFEDKLVLPGGHVEESDLNLVLACQRELFEEIGLVVPIEYIQFLMKLDRGGRDPRYLNSTSDVFLIKLDYEPRLTAQSDAREVVVRELHSIVEEEIGFDHFEAIQLIQKKY